VTAVNAQLAALRAQVADLGRHRLRQDEKIKSILGTMREAAEAMGTQPPDAGPRLTLCEARLNDYDKALAILYDSRGPRQQDRRARRGHLRLVPDQAAQ
jgi:hypothetical protein